MDSSPAIQQTEPSKKLQYMKLANRSGNMQLFIAVF